MYLASCESDLVNILKVIENDFMHHDPKTIITQYNTWNIVKNKYFVVDESIEQARKPGLWKIEYQTLDTERSEFVALSPVRPFSLVFFCVTTF